MLVQIQFRSDTLANWTAANPVLAVGEPAYEEDTHRQRIGDGVTAYIDLPVQSADPAAFQALTDQAIAAAAAAQAAADDASAAAGGLLPASTTQVGVSRFATNTETATGTAVDIGVTPAGLASVLSGFAGTVPDATTTVKGKVELATDAETTTGTSSTLAVTPAGVAAAIAASGVSTPDSSTTVKGIVELATTAETQTGTDAVRAVTPAGFAAAIGTYAMTLTGNQTVAGTKTFTSPVVGATPTGSTHLATKGYVDTAVAGGPVSSVNSLTGAVVLTQDTVGDGTTYKRYSATDKALVATIPAKMSYDLAGGNAGMFLNHRGVWNVGTEPTSKVAGDWWAVKTA